MNWREKLDSARKSVGEGTICLFHVGDFYEAFFEDAEYCAKTLGLTLTTRDPVKSKADTSMPMAGFPYHQLESYVAKLVASGKRVAVCEMVA